ncbi:pre-mRNA-processing factor 39 isoform X2 [Venturia canescens]|uniref:pre-mRNA-processing factor 39 isoform X2 n=1 Tax=Venturia canescens TaxID=32260 RepID=UPI001C9BFF8C|nr:pre-mRNA-processing factor 39-like isoform X2 [Venturia canescens]
MSSLSGDESEVIQTEPVRRTRSGRARKVPAAKKSPIKKTPRATRMSKKIQEEVDEIEEVVSHEEEEIEEAASENGLQQFSEIIIENYGEEDPSTLHLQMEDSQDESSCIIEQDTEVEGYVQMDQETQGVPELEAPPPPVVSNIPTSAPILSTLRVKEPAQIMEEGEGGTGRVITLDDNSVDENSMEKIEMLSHQSVTMEEEVTNGDSSDTGAMQDQSIDLNEALAVEEDAQVLETQELETDNPSVEIETERMEVDESVEEVQEPVETIDVPNEFEDAEKSVVETVHENPDDLDGDENADKTEPDTEAVSEDEFPTEVAAKEPETEAVSDEELPAAPPTDLGETESVSEDELPPDSDKKRRSGAKAAAKLAEKKSKAEGAVKRKLNAEGEYDPSSPTSETNEETPAKKAALTVESEADEKQEPRPPSPKKKTLPELEKYWKAVNEDPSDFTGWTYLLQYVDQENDPEAAREAYNKFLERYPYCYGYWRKFADYEKKKGDPENVQTVFDQGLKAISLSVDLWLHYINHCKVVYEKDETKLREQYERAIQACGLEFRSDRLWESYIKWEQEGKRLSRVTALYDRLLSTPTFGYKGHFENFQEFVSSNLPNRILSVDDFLALRAEVKALLKSEDTAPAIPADDAPPGEEPPPHEAPPTDEETRALREKIISSRRKMHKANVSAVSARWSYEEGIKRPYFHVKPLERCQLKNWKEYLDFEIEQKDQDRIIILFERCLIACALYDEFWLRFVRYLESLKGENSEKIRDVYCRACTVHHPKKPNLHLQWAVFEESQGDFDKAASILEKIDTVMPNMLQIAYRRINLERRRNDLEKACELYESYIGNSKNRTIGNNIAVKYARFLYKFKNDIDKAVKVLLKAADKDKDNPRLYLQLIDLGLQRNPVDTEEVVGYMDMFIEREHADLEQRVLFAQRKVEFLEDFSLDISQVMKAHDQFQKCIKQAKERKKAKTDESKVDSSPPKKPKTGDQSSVPPPPTVGTQSSYQYSSGPSGPYQSQQQFQSGQYGGQGGYQQGYQQYPPPSDPNYANYQNWQYSQGGPPAYGSYNQWGSYNYY